MELYLKRTTKTRTYTMGRLSILNQLGYEHFCDTLEPSLEPIDHKLPRAIQPGRYAVTITWSPKFRQWLPLLLNVPRREGIRIHAGNDPLHTKGCILVGQALLDGHVYNSRKTLEKLIWRLRERPEGEGVWITVDS